MSVLSKVGRFAFLIFFPLILESQLIPPVEHQMSLTGSFGELRNNHFHEGYDVRKDHAIKQNKILAVMDGFVSRISISSEGYGNMIVIEHPNGTSSLYGHLEKFNTQIAEFVHSYQYSNHTFEMDVRDLRIPVKQGDVIGIMGNTGSSRGVHLHFEMLNTKTGTKINPALYNLKIPDDYAPIFESIKIVGLDYEYNSMNSKILNVHRKSNDTFSITGDTVRMGNINIGVEVKVYDLMNANKFHVGIYKLSLLENDTLKYSVIFDSIQRNFFPNYKAHIDFAQYLENGAEYHRTYVLPGDKMSNYFYDKSNPFIGLDYNVSKKIEIIAEDYSGNKSYLNFVALLDQNIEIPYRPAYSHHIKLGDSCEIVDDDFVIELDGYDFFKNVYFLAEKKDTNILNTYSKAIEICNNKEAFRDEIELSIKVDTFDQNIDNLCIVRIDKGKRKNLGGKLIDGYIKTTVSEEGVYIVMADISLPSIKPVRFNKNMKKYYSMSFKIDDNLVPNHISPLKYNGYIDGNWVLFEYDKKNKLITHNFEKNLYHGKHNIRIVVEDYSGNVAEYNNTFIK